MEYISIGQNCASVTSFVKNGVMKNKKNGRKTCFFDLMISSYYGICKIIENNFFDIFEDLEIIDNIKNKKYKNRNNCLFFSYGNNKPYNNKLIVNKKYAFWFNHESEGNYMLFSKEKWSSIDFFTKNNLEQFKIRYKKRIENFKNIINDCIINNKELFFVLNTYVTPLKLSEIIKKKYPNLKFKILCNKLDNINIDFIENFCKDCCNIETLEKKYDGNYKDENIIMNGWNMIQKKYTTLI